MLVHSYIYYELNQNIVSDHKWSRWAKELEQLQKDYPKESAEVEYADQFVDWDGSSGAFLEFSENIKSIAHHLLCMRENGRKSKRSDFKISEKISKTGAKKIKSNTRSLF